MWLIHTWRLGVAYELYIKMKSNLTHQRQQIHCIWLRLTETTFMTQHSLCVTLFPTSFHTSTCKLDESSMRPLFTLIKGNLWGKHSWHIVWFKLDAMHPLQILDLCDTMLSCINASCVGISGMYVLENTSHKMYALLNYRTWHEAKSTAV